MEMKFKNDKENTWLENESGERIAVLNHPEVAPGIVNFAHTIVDGSLRGQGVADKITRAAADRLREKGLKAELTCSYSIKWFAQHPEYRDVLADPGEEDRKAGELAGPACGIQRPKTED